MPFQVLARIADVIADSNPLNRKNRCSGGFFPMSLPRSFAGWKRNSPMNENIVSDKGRYVKWNSEIHDPESDTPRLKPGTFTALPI